MKLPFKTILLYGLLLWFIPFSVAFIVFPTKNFFAPLFETIMAVTLALCAVIFALLHFRKMQSDYIRQGVLVGAIWFAISILIDAPFFLFGGPMQMTFPNYLMDIGLT